jgi:uncharacterized membrane protein
VNLYLTLRFLHLAASMLFVGGLFSRQVVRSLAGQAKDVSTLVTLNLAAGRVERWLVIPGNLLTIVFGLFLALLARAPIFGSLAAPSRNWLLASIVLLVLLMPLVPLVFLPRGRLFEAALQEAVRRNELTPEVRRRLEDPVVRWAHAAELTGVALIVALMVFKPF